MLTRLMQTQVVYKTHMEEPPAEEEPLFSVELREGAWGGATHTSWKSCQRRPRMYQQENLKTKYS